MFVQTFKNIDDILHKDAGCGSGWVKLNTLFLILFAVFIPLCGLAQAQNKIDSLTIELIKLEAEILERKEMLEKINSEIDNIKRQELYALSSNSIGEFTVDAVLKMQGKIKKNADPFSEILTIVPAGDTVKLTDYKKGYWVINKGEFFGYISEIYFVETKSLLTFKKELIRKNDELLRQEEEKKKKADAEMLEKASIEYKNKLTKKYGASTADKLLKGYIWLGMTKEMAKISLGDPRNINRSVGSWGVKEQWVYHSVYLYFDNGILSSYQD